MDKLYRFQTPGMVRMLSSTFVDAAKAQACKIWGKGFVKSSRVTVFPRHLTPEVAAPNGAAYDEWTNKLDVADTGAKVKAMQRGGSRDWSYNQEQCKAPKAVAAFAKMLRS